MSRTRRCYRWTTSAVLSRDEYTPEHVRHLITEYAALRERADTSTPSRRNALHELADLNRALARLSLKYWEVVLVHGLLGIPHREAAGVLRVSHQAVGKRYRLALEDITYLINGGD